MLPRVKDVQKLKGKARFLRGNMLSKSDSEWGLACLGTASFERALHSDRESLLIDVLGQTEGFWSPGVRVANASSASRPAWFWVASGGFNRQRLGPAAIPDSASLLRSGLVKWVVDCINDKSTDVAMLGHLDHFGQAFWV